MKARHELLESIADTIEDYRAGELSAPTPDHVDRWIRQFGTDVQLPVLREMDHVLQQTYFSESSVRRFFDRVIENERLAGSKPREFWWAAHLLDVQQDGNSQSEIRKLFSDAVERKYGVAAGAAGVGNGVFVYLDDVLFSGGRVGADLSKWIAEQAPSTATVHVVTIASHRFGEWKCKSRLTNGAREAGKQLQFRLWAARRVENRLSHRNESELLWPVAIPEDAALTEYLAQEEKFPFRPRKTGGQLQWPVFSTEDGRQLLERELLLAGMRIRSFSQSPSPAMRPLGFSPFGLGFGSMIVTYRNCPNNAPLALWWGDPDAHPNHPFSHWYPLLQRRTYSRSG